MLRTQTKSLLRTDSWPENGMAVVAKNCLQTVIDQKEVSTCPISIAESFSTTYIRSSKPKPGNLR